MHPHRQGDACGRALLKAAEYRPLGEVPDDDYPFLLTTGRVAHQFQTRTKTGRSEALNHAAPVAYAQIAAEDAQRLGVAEGERLRLTSRRGQIVVAARLDGIKPGEVFVPFHYGHHDGDGGSGAANELTFWGWDAVSKQPFLKHAAVQIEKDTLAGAAKAASLTVLGAADNAASGAMHALHRVEPKRTHVADCLGLRSDSERTLVDGFRQLREQCAAEPDVEAASVLLGSWSEEAHTALVPFVAKYGEHHEHEPKKLQAVLLKQRGTDAYDQLRSSHDLFLAVNKSLISLTSLLQAAQALRDEDLLSLLQRAKQRNERQQEWLMTRIKQSAAQALVVPS